MSDSDLNCKYVVTATCYCRAALVLVKWCFFCTISRKVLPLLSVYWMSSCLILLLLSFFFFFLRPFFLASSFSFSSLSKSSAVFRRVSGHQPFIFLARKMENRGPARSLAIEIEHLLGDLAARTMSLRRNSMAPEGGRTKEG